MLIKMFRCLFFPSRLLYWHPIYCVGSMSITPELHIGLRVTGAGLGLELIRVCRDHLRALLDQDKQNSREDVVLASLRGIMMRCRLVTQCPQSEQHKPTSLWINGENV